MHPAAELRPIPHPRARPEIFRRLARATAPRQRPTVSGWADANRIISPKQGAEAGPWRTSRNPLLREPMDSLGHRGDVVLMFPIQLGKTEVLLNDIGCTMAEDPCPIMVCLPGEVSLNKWVAQKLQPMIDETPAVRATLSSTASRESANSRTFKDFAGGQIYIEHAGSPARLKSATVRKLRVDELDEFAANLSGGDDPVEMLNGRTSAYPANYSRAYVSTPQLKSTSRIYYLWEQSDQRRYHVPCPHCGHAQPLMWSGLRWSTLATRDTPRRAWYVCAECGCEIEEYAKTAMMAAGTWVAGRPDARIKGYNTNCLYYPLGLGPRWADLVDMWLAAQGDPARLKTFVNDRLAEPWEDKSTANVRSNLVQERAQPYPLRVAQPGVLAITAGVDTQDDRLEVHIVGWGRRKRWWTLDYVVLAGDTSLPDVWAALTDLLNRPIQHTNGALMGVEATSVDMLGHRTETVKGWVRDRLVRRPMASFGAKANTAPILGKAKLSDVTRKGKTDKRGVHVYQLGTVDAKHVLFGQLAADHDAWQAWQALPDDDSRPAAPDTIAHFSADLPDSFFSGLVSEVYNPSKARFEKRRGAIRNEPLDTWVHAFAASHHPELRLHRATEAEWASREANLNARATVQPQAAAADTGQALATPAPLPPAPGAAAATLAALLHAAREREAAAHAAAAAPAQAVDQPSAALAAMLAARKKGRNGR